MRGREGRKVTGSEERGHSTPLLLNVKVKASQVTRPKVLAVESELGSQGPQEGRRETAALSSDCSQRTVTSHPDPQNKYME